MKRMETMDSLLVKLVDEKTDYPIATYYTKNWKEVLDYYATVMKYELDITIAGEENEKYENHFFKIKDIATQFGGNIGINVLEIFVEVF